MSHPTQPPPGQVLTEMLMGTWVARAVYAAAKLGIADHLLAGPQPVEELARATGTLPDPLYRALRALASVGMFTETEGRRFGLTPLAETLVSHRPGSMRAMALMMGDPWHWKVWGDVLHTLRTGQNAAEHVLGGNVFAYFAKDPEAGRTFNEAMTSFSTNSNGPIVEAYDFAGVRTLADVGGGHGSLLVAILKRHRHLQGLLFDAPPVIAEAQEHLAHAELGDRLRTAAGDFFQAVPQGADAYLMKHIIHDWDDRACTTILGNVRKVLPDGGKVLICEMVIPPGNDPFPAKILDLEMMVTAPNGRERTAEEFRALLAGAGFRLTRIVPTVAPVSVIEGVKA